MSATTVAAGTRGESLAIGDPTVKASGFGRIAAGIGKVTNHGPGRAITTVAGLTTIPTAGSGCQTSSGGRRGSNGVTTAVIAAGRL